MNPRLIPTSRLARVTVLRSQSDERLGELVRHGSDAAFEAIVHRYRRALVGHCVRILGSVADAEEAVQDAFVSAHGALVNGNEVRSLGPWLHAVAHNAALRILRRRVARAEYPQEDCNGHWAVDPPHTARAELRELVQAVQALPPRQRDAIVMRELEGRSYAEIAERLGASDGAVRQLLNRARHSMRESLGALIPAEPLLRWLLSADDSSPAKGLLTLSGGSAAIAIKVSGAAVVSAVSVVTLLPPAHRAAQPLTGTRAPAAVRRTASVPPASQAIRDGSGTHFRRAFALHTAQSTSKLRAVRPAAHPADQVALQWSKPASSRSAGGGQQHRAGSAGSPLHPGSSRSQAPTRTATGAPTATPSWSGTRSPGAGAPPGGSSMFETTRSTPGQPQTMNGSPPQQPGQATSSGATASPGR